MNSRNYLRAFLIFTAINHLILLNGYRAEAGWEMMTVDSSGVVGLYTSIALDASNKVHISYSGNTDLKYATNSSSTWVTETVDSIGEVGAFTSLALDGSGNPHISYHDRTNEDLKYAHYNGSWQIQTVYSDGSVGRRTSLALDSNDNPHIAFYGYANTPVLDVNNKLYYVFYNGSSWAVEWFSPIYHMYSAPDYLSLALDSSNTPHFSYCNGTVHPFDLVWYPENLGYAYYDGSWHDEIGVAGAGEYVSLSIDSRGNLHFSYYDRTNGDLKYDGEVVDSNGDVGQYTSLALDSNNMPHISYYDNSNQDLKYAYYDGMNWHREVVDSTGIVGTYTALALDSNDIPHISYYDISNTNLKYAEKYCESTDVDCDGIVNEVDNCSGRFNPGQQDTYPPQGNNIGDACDCECDFLCDGDVDADDVTAFIADFGREPSYRACTNASPCKGDTDCDVDVDADDVNKFIEDFGREPSFKPCPACVAGAWCVYE